MPVAAFTVTVYADILALAAGRGVDISCAVLAVDVLHGRDDTSGQPEASSATLDLNLRGAPLPPEVEVGAPLMVDAVTALGVSRRFAGKVTDLTLGWDARGEATPDSAIGQLVATGLLADLGRRVVGDDPFPQELDGARVARVLRLAGVTLDPAVSDPGTVQILPRDVDAQPALDVAYEVAESGGGIVWQTRAGQVRYADAEHRRNLPVDLDLDACQLLVSPSWQRTTDGLINDVSIGYGPTPEEGEQPRFYASDAASIARYGRFAVSAATQLAALEDAQEMGLLLVTRNASPVWLMTALPVAVQTLDDPTYEALLGLEMHSLVRVTGLPVAGSAPTSAVLWLEGWKEHLEFGVHDLELIVSGYCRTVPPPRWDDLTPELTWDTVPASLTWNGAACIGPQPNRGRWSDVSASLRWNAVPPEVTWDTWPTYVNP